MSWNFTPPTDSELGDREVPRDGNHLQGKRIALLITGGIAAMKAPLIARALRRQGAEVVAFTSEDALRYVTIDALEWSTINPVITRLTAAAEHLSDRSPFDVYLVAPATYNTINKFRHGIADGVISSALASALGRMERGKTKILIVPTMHGSLHNSILTESLKTLDRMGVSIMSPRDDYGKHNLPGEKELAIEICRLVSESPLKDRSILVTGGPTPVEIDSIRRLTNRFTGRLGASITEELYLSGADAFLLHGRGSYEPPSYLPHRIVETYDEYLAGVMEELDKKSYLGGIFSAAVADYRPDRVLSGKTPSGGALNRIDLVPTGKVIEKVRERFPALYMMTFKYQEGVSHGELMAIARDRLARGYQAVIANRGEETGENGEQVAYLVTESGESPKMVGKKAIARSIVEHLERVPGQ
ncbi:phosphopantothenoylcysteine decarboxylase [Pannus brasiliensis CCIBt3594]|uniref:Phosphopantothenoylcysteine decarboxylase n=1 Tax=Pannus brasiliensis CCIBt3594 TaxID=1427578 RepID=A0AAW9R1D0_9CHRO